MASWEDLGKQDYNRRRTLGGKLETFLSSNSILETIEEDVNTHRPSVPPNFGNQNNEFKIPSEEGHVADNVLLNKENNKNNFSPPHSMPEIVCETPKKVLRERVNNYKNMFESSMKENNELREFTTLEKQMFYENNEQLKDLDILKKKLEELQNEKDESTRMIEKLKRSICNVENDKRDIEVIMEMQKTKYENRESELLTTIQEIKDELESNKERLKRVLSNDNLIVEKQSEINRLETAINKMNRLNETYFNEIENLKSQLLYKDQKLNEELVKHCSVLNEVSHLKNNLTEIRSISWTTKFLENEGYFTLKKCEIDELRGLLGHAHNTIDQLQQDNQALKDENNNFKLITDDLTSMINNVQRENDELKSKLNHIEINIKSVIKDFSASAEINVDSSQVDSLIEFAADYFEQNTNKIDELLNENIHLKEELFLMNYKFCEVKSFMLITLDSIYDNVSTMETVSSTKMENSQKELLKSVEENLFLKSSIKAFDKLTLECVEIIESTKINQSNIIQLKDNFAVCSTMKNELQLQIEQLNGLKISIKNQTSVEKEIREDLDTKSVELKNALVKLDELQLELKDNEYKTNSNSVTIDHLNIELQTVKSYLEEKSNLVVELEVEKLELLTNYSELEKCYQSSVENVKCKEEIESQLQVDLLTKSNDLQKSINELTEMKMKIESNESEIKRLNTLLDSVRTELDEKLKLMAELDNYKVEHKIVVDQLNELNIMNSDLKNKLEEKCVSENKILADLLTKTKELENAFVRLDDCQSSYEEMKIKTDSNDNTIIKLNSELDIVKCELLVKSKLIEEFENNKSEAIKYLEEINKLNNVINNLQCELKDKMKTEEILQNELLLVTKELDDVMCIVNNVKLEMDHLKNQRASYISVVEQLTSDFENVKFTLNDKNRLIFELETANLNLLSKCKNSEVTDQLNKIIVELEVKLENKTNIENDLQNELQAKSLLLEDALVKENEAQFLILSIKNEIKSSNDLLEHVKSELASKSTLLIEAENMKSELLLKCNELEFVKLKEYEQIHTNLREQLDTVIQEKNLTQTDLNLTNHKFLEITKLYSETKDHLDGKLQLLRLNYKNVNEEFISLSYDIESLFQLKIKTEFDLKEEILHKSTIIDDLQKQIQESSLDDYYSKLEEEYMLKSREYEKAQERIVNLETLLSAKEINEVALKSNLEAKCNALAEYKKNVEFLFSRNDSFQIRVNDFEDNVLVDLNEEFDSMKLELAKKTEYENALLEEKSKLESNLIELQDKLINVTKDLELSEERSENLESTIELLVIEIKDANSHKEKLESCLFEAEHELLKAEDLAKNLEHELCILQTEFDNACSKVENIEKEFHTIESKFKDEMNKKYFENFEASKQLNDSLDYVHSIKLKLTELNSAMISGNKCEKKFRTKAMLAEVDVLSLNESWKENSGTQSPKSHGTGLEQEINNLQKELEDKTDLISNLQKTSNEMKNIINEHEDLIQRLSDDNIALINNIKLIKNDLNEKKSLVNNLSDELRLLKKQYAELEELQKATEKQIVNDLKEKESLVSNLSDELSQVKKQCTELEKHNRVTKEQIHLNLDIDSELRNGKKTIIQEINQLEPGKITGVLSHNDLSHLFDTFVNLIMTKEQQIVTNLINEQIKAKQQYEEQIKQYLEDIKKGKEWQEQVESDNEKLSLELDILKSQKRDFPSKEIEIKELTEKVLEAEVQSYNYLTELQELKTKISKTSEENYHALSLEFEAFKASSEQSIQGLQKKIEDLTDKYNESLSMYKDQKSGRSTLESQVVKFQTECVCLKAILEKKDIDIKNLIGKVEMKTEEYKILVEKNSVQKEEMRNILEKRVDELQLELNEKTQKMNYSEKLLKEATKNYNQLVKENMSNLLKIKQLESSCETSKNCELLEKEIKDMKEEIEDLKLTNVNLDSECESMLVEIKNQKEDNIQLAIRVSELKQNVTTLIEERDFLKNQCNQFKNVNGEIKKLNDEISGYEQNIYQLRKEKGQLIVQHEKELKQIKSELNEASANNLKLSSDYNNLAETAKNLEKSLKEDIQQLNRCIVDKNAKISTLELFSKTNTDELKKKYHELEYVFKKARDENHMLRKECRRLKELGYVRKVDQSTQTVEEQSVVSSALMAGHKSMTEKITKLENDNMIMKKMLHHRKSKIEELQKQLAERH